MNNKQLACVILIVGILVAIQGALALRKRAHAIAVEAETASQKEAGLRKQLAAEQSVLVDWQRQSKDLISFVKNWEPYFAVIEEQQAAETGISMKVREAGMFNLSQSYQQVAHKINNKDNASLPTLVRATLIFDDSYPKLMNWIGLMEKIKPTMRLGRLSISKGSRANDIKMEVVLEIPLMKK